MEDLSEKIKKFFMQNSKTVDSQFDKFMLTLSSVVNQHAPFKRASRREKQLQKKNLFNSTA